LAGISMQPGWRRLFWGTPAILSGTSGSMP
jgi:hypothetical protein